VTPNGMPSPGPAVRFEPIVDPRGKITYKCPECETTTATLSLMQMHYKKHLNTNGKLERTISQVEHLSLRPPRGLAAVCEQHLPNSVRMCAKLNSLGVTAGVCSLPQSPAKSTKLATTAGSSGGSHGKSGGGPPHMSPEDWVKQQVCVKRCMWARLVGPR